MTIFDAARRAGVPVGNACGLRLVCAACRVTIVSGAPSLSPISPPEALLHRRERFASDERASCQTRVYGDAVVTAGYW
jgi:ferredoxin